MESGLITFFVGIIAVCMVVITILAVQITLKMNKSINHFDECVAHAHSELQFLSTKLALTLEEIHDVILKVSNSIAKVTMGSLLIGVVSNIFKKKSN